MAMAVSAGTINWWAEIINSSQTGDEISPANVTFFIFALGGSDQDFGNGGLDVVYQEQADLSLKASTVTLTAVGGAAFSPMGSSFAMVGSDWYTETGWSDLDITWGNPSGDTDSTSPCNQWWAVVVVDNETLGLYGWHSFEVTDQKLLVPVSKQGPASDFLDVGAFTGTFTIIPIPEPFTVGLALAGVALLVVQRKRK